MNLLSGVCPVRGERRGGLQKSLKVSGMGQVRQVQKWQMAQKEKSADFKSPDLGSSAYTLITTTTDFDTNYFFFFLRSLC